jgi:hypothetical protein
MADDDVKRRRELGIDEALVAVGEFGLAQKVQIAVVSI